MEKLLMRNIYNARFVIGSLAAFSLLSWQLVHKQKLMIDVYGVDGNGGRMLKIITDLSDEEMARLKYARRFSWHWKGSRRYTDTIDPISDQELADRGIEVKQEPFVEYMKRPPHDKYL
uniref:Uncharacterized protein n=1 Tax=Strombidium rassoulzadegani TaxID=1082188 RepID=A0A7S3FYA6_9SPIT